ncbi:MAG: gliding motility-associated C-terminal domain-containing protein [Bacteroidota bacterium]
MSLIRYLLLFFFSSAFYAAYGQQDVDFHLNATLLPGKNILKVKRDVNDPYLWVLAQGNEVYRINSTGTPLVAEDFTAKFAAYNSLPFIDIVGISKDQFYIAAKSANVIEYKNEVLKNIGVADGVPGVVNSIGIDAAGAYNSYKVDNLVIIATSNGMVRYNFVTATIVPAVANAETKIFEASYRNEMFHDGSPGRGFADVVDHYSLLELVDYTIFGNEIWLGGEYGTNLRTAFFTKGSMWGNTGFTLFADLFWATENGMFQLKWGNLTSAAPHNQYLNGVQINKITSIYGLASFTESGALNGTLGKENLLIGTNQGLYFSNSKYQKGNSKYDIFHYDGLGAKIINDICVNATTYNIVNRYAELPCEDGVWVAAIDGLYLLKPDYVPYLNITDKLQGIQFDGQPYNVSEIQICNNTSTKANVQGVYYKGNLIQWYKDGVELPNESGTSLTITQPGDYNAVFYDPCSTVHFETNHLKVTVVTAPVVTFNYPDNMKYCDGSTASLSTDYNLAYQYRWYKDGVLNGNISPGLNNITQSGKYKVEVSACSGSWVASKEVQIDFVKVPPPVITADKAAYCAGSPAVLTATVPIDATGIINWPTYQFRWYANGTPINSNTSATFNTTVPGKYRVEVFNCAGGLVTSADFQLNFITLTTPALNANKSAYCIGDAATLSTPFVNDGTYTINWLIGGSVIPSGKNQTSITIATPGIYTVSISSNVTSCSQTSAPYVLSFEPPPTLTLERIINTTLCDGQTVDLKASYSGGTIKWSTGEVTDKIGIRQSGTYTATVKTAAGCEVAQNIGVQFLRNPVLSLPDATLCQFTNEQLTLIAPAGFTKYEWNGQAGGATYTTGSLSTVTLTVTDQNGCKASQTINITSHCKDIHIPNTFTPNGDGINDKWIIAGLEGDLTVNVKVYGRTGELIFQSLGYAIPWDGTYQSKKIPAGVYYYVINAKGSNQVLSGSITIIY